jgi:hypothetical protein
MQQVNAMGATLRAQRLGALEATTLLRKVMEEIDVAVFAFDSAHRLRLVNRAGRAPAEPARERLLSAERRRTLGSRSSWMANRRSYLPARTSRAALAAGACAAVRSARRPAASTSGDHGPHPPLREEELQAWQRLVRVLGHELNNSLTPIKSIAGSLGSMIARDPKPDDWEEDMQRGLAVIATRSEALSRFMGAYARLAKLPRPPSSPYMVSEAGAGGERSKRASSRRSSPGPELVIQATPINWSSCSSTCCATEWTRRWKPAAALKWAGRARILNWRSGSATRVPGHLEHRQPVRPVLHHQAGRFGHRAGAEPPDRRSARRHIDARKPPARTSMNVSPIIRTLTLLRSRFR